MIAYHSADAIRAAERATGTLFSDGVLMKRAAYAVAATVIAELGRGHAGVYGRRVGLVVGAGDNGGDALYAARHLRRRGVAVDAVLTAPERVHAAALADFRDSGGRIVGELSIGTTDIVVDAVVGLGGHGPLRDPVASVFAAVHAAGIPVVAVDLPSGVDPDTGTVHDPAVRADVSVTFDLPRLAHLLAAPQCGRVVIAEIGVPDNTPPELASPSDAEIAACWPVPGPGDDKYTQGVVGVIAGSARYPGAAVLCTDAAVAASSGMTRYVGAAVREVLARNPETVAVTDLADAGRVQAWVIGPGGGTGEASAQILERVLADDVPVLVDADALTVLAGNAHLRELVRARSAPTLLTPHAGEFARLAAAAGSGAADLLTDGHRLAAVRRLASETGATVLLKGRITLVADPDGTVWGNDARASWAATAGSGDVLAGIAGALLAAGLAPRVAGTAAARVHGLAARRASGGAPIGASQLAAAVRPALQDLLHLRQWKR
ncbi:NAD(P)H-hydrate dehydratase [Gordonia zhaorongruii]|uniref:NAD(P)H-hydrate dehydratase n=1 Tax=Gordonia zhaorongruii TaxID=2597659 RepID=UPI00104E231D|nr:NAD(P)H-hydrate dehydratase [Gordonia zhaorongruii]